MTDSTVNVFRRRRGRLLREQIKALAARLGRAITIVDVGGRTEYWRNVMPDGVARIGVMNHDESELGPSIESGIPFETCIGDARDMSSYDDGSVDLIHSNSVIEHVGSWDDMVAMARELRRVGRSGWVQTPAWEFPIEPHFRLPFMHWTAQPVRASLLRLNRTYAGFDHAERRRHTERINLLSRKEVGMLFPGCDVWVERVVLAKSYVVRW